MGIFDVFRRENTKEKRPQETIKEKVQFDEKIEYLDEFGIKKEKLKYEWIEEVLNPNIDKNWDNADELYLTVLDAFSKKIYYEVKEACLRIYKIDENKERRTNILGMYYAKVEEYDKAIELYEKYTFYEKKSEGIYINYAKILEKIGDIDKAENFYLKAISQNINSKNALKKYFNIIKKRNISEYRKKLEELSELENSWRVKLILGLEYFKEGNKEEGDKYLELALIESSYNSDVMQVASAIYGMNGLYEEFEKYILKNYKPEEHGKYTALNILEYYKNTENIEKGLELCKYTSKFSWEEFEDKFIEYEKYFLNKQKGINNFIENQEFFNINYPIWYYSLKEPKWLLNNTERRDPNILMLLFTSICEGDNYTKDEKILSDKLAVSLPLYLNQILHFNSDMYYQLVIPHQGDKIKISNKKYTIDYINIIKEQNTSLDYILSGNIVVLDKENKDELPSYEIEAYLYDCRKDLKIKLLNQVYLEKELFLVQYDLIRKVSEFFNLNISNISEEINIENLMLFSENLKLLFKNPAYKKMEAWKYKKELRKQINLVLEDINNEFKKITLISLLYEISIYNSQLLKLEKLRIYKMVEKNIFNTENIKLLVPIIYNIYKDEENYNKYISNLNIEDSEYIGWINKFLDYTELD